MTFRGAFAKIPDVAFDNCFRRRGNKDALRMFGGKFLSATRSARLIQNRCPLWRGLAEVETRYFEIFAVVSDPMDLSRISENTFLSISFDCVSVPAPLPELIADFHVFFRQLIAIVMLSLLIEAKVSSSALQIAGDHIPAKTTFGQVIERRGSPGERIGMLIGQS